MASLVYGVHYGANFVRIGDSCAYHLGQVLRSSGAQAHATTMATTIHGVHALRPYGEEGYTKDALS